MMILIDDVAQSNHHTQVGGSSKDSFLHKDEELQAKLLQDCSSADVVTCISTEMASGALNHSKLYVRQTLPKL
jgi:hypothetical protein